LFWEKRWLKKRFAGRGKKEEAGAGKQFREIPADLWDCKRYWSLRSTEKTAASRGGLLHRKREFMPCLNYACSSAVGFRTGVVLVASLLAWGRPIENADMTKPERKDF